MRGIAFWASAALWWQSMNRIFYKFSVLILLPVFCIVSIFSVLGYAWCFGDDGHFEVAYLSSSACCESVVERPGSLRVDEFSLISFGEELCDSCLDLSAQKSDAIFLKRLKRLSSHPDKPVPANGFVNIYRQTSQPFVAELLLRPLPRVSQTLLVHRTIVILTWSPLQIRPDISILFCGFLYQEDCRNFTD